MTSPWFDDDYTEHALDGSEQGLEEYPVTEED